MTRLCSKSETSSITLKLTTKQSDTLKAKRCFTPYTVGVDVLDDPKMNGKASPRVILSAIELEEG